MAKNNSAIGSFYERHPFLSHVILVCLTVVVLSWLAMLFLDIWTSHGATSVVPEIKNKSYDEAVRLLESNDLEIEISDSVYDVGLPPGTIVESWPKAGAVVKAGRQVYVTLTAFSPKQVTISMPLTGNVSSRQAMSYLKGIGISDIRVQYVPSEYADLVINARYGDTPLNVGSVIPVNSTVTLCVGSGSMPAPVDTLTAEETIINELPVSEIEDYEF